MAAVSEKICWWVVNKYRAKANEYVLDSKCKKNICTYEAKRLSVMDVVVFSRAIV